MRDASPASVPRLSVGLALAAAVSLVGCSPVPLAATATTSAGQAPVAATRSSAPATAEASAVVTPSATVRTSATSAGSAKPTPRRPTASTSTSPSGTVSASGALSGMVAAAGAYGRPSTGGARLRPTRSGSLSGTVIVVDPGHNGTYISSILTRQVPAGNGTTKACNTSGTESVGGVGEHAVNWAVSVRLVALLRAQGATVVVTRPSADGVGPCVNERAAIANRAKADLVLSVHGDGNLSPSARGFHVITSTTMAGGSALESRSLALARHLVAAMKRNTPLPASNYIGGGTGISKRSDIAGLNLLSTSPGAMVEMGNLRQSGDWAYLSSTAGVSGVARALADAAVAYLG